jgi:cytochrome c biogenesis protein CcmG/thiol:disulfide interchange protein DsbE
VAVVGAQSSPSRGGTEVLAKVREKYASLKTYDFKATALGTFEMEGATHRATMPLEMVKGEPPQDRMSLRYTIFTVQMVGGNGENEILKSGTFLPPGPKNLDFAQVGLNVAYANLLREQATEVNGKTVRCYVVELLDKPDLTAPPRMPVPTARTVWVDEETFLVVRETFRQAVRRDKTNPITPVDWDVTFGTYALDGPVPEWLARADREDVEHRAKLSASMIGSKAPDFKLRDAYGREVSLADERDRVVLLDFWGTWCGPCVAELPNLSALEKQWGAKGLVVVRITNEPTEDVQYFEKRTQQAVATLVDGEETSKQYKVEGVPTIVLIDRTGKIVAYDSGFLSEAELTTRLAKAGLN